MYFLHLAFPDRIGIDDTLRGFDYVLARHPVSNVSYVCSVGTTSKLIGYGNNRADYSFIPGGMRFSGMRANTWSTPPRHSFWRRMRHKHCRGSME